ncbi:MAG: hypothetical protein C0478_01790 [Planctomyces sp.]|nr:hypothetical protein [Planctomyces sp.]
MLMLYEIFWDSNRPVIWIGAGALLLLAVYRWRSSARRLFRLAKLMREPQVVADEKELVVRQYGHALSNDVAKAISHLGEPVEARWIDTQPDYEEIHIPWRFVKKIQLAGPPSKPELRIAFEFMGQGPAGDVSLGPEVLVVREAELRDRLAEVHRRLNECLESHARSH